MLFQSALKSRLSLQTSAKRCARNGVSFQSALKSRLSLQACWKVILEGRKIVSIRFEVASVPTVVETRLVKEDLFVSIRFEVASVPTESCFQGS